MFSKSALLNVRYIRISRTNLGVIVYFDAVFAVKKDKTSQLGILVLLWDVKNRDANILSVRSCKKKLCYESILPLDLFVMDNGLDVGFKVANSLESMFKQTGTLTMYSDNQFLHGLYILLSQSTERPMQIYLSLEREAYQNHEITKIFWIATQFNPTDDPIKTKKRGGVLANMAESNHFMPQAQSWILFENGIEMERHRCKLNKRCLKRKFVECCDEICLW